MEKCLQKILVLLLKLKFFLIRGGWNNLLKIPTPSNYFKLIACNILLVYSYFCVYIFTSCNLVFFNVFFPVLDEKCGFGLLISALLSIVINLSSPLLVL